MCYNQEQMIILFETYRNFRIYIYRLFDVYVYYLAIALQTNTANVIAFSKMFKTEEHVLTFKT